MARRKQYQKSDFPVPGTVYIMPLSDGRLGVCRILRIGSDLGAPAVLVATSPWIGVESPSLASSEIQKTLRLTHHSWSGNPYVVWISEPPPATFTKLGQIHLPKKDLKTDSGSLAAWDSLPLQVLTQWRWDNEREAVLTEDIERERNAARELTRRGEERKQYLSKVTLAELAQKDLFPQWDEYPPPDARRDTLNAMHELIDRLRSAPKLTASAARTQLEMAVHKLNQLDQLHGGFIETIEREDICDAFEEILAAAKFPELLESIHDWRDW
jgi:hypothetical protein